MQTGSECTLHAVRRRPAGVTTSTIYRAIRRGQLPACKLRGGNYAIYPAELRRAFPSAVRASAAGDGGSAGTFLFPAWDVS